MVFQFEIVVFLILIFLFLSLNFLKITFSICSLGLMIALIVKLRHIFNIFQQVLRGLKRVTSDFFLYNNFLYLLAILELIIFITQYFVLTLCKTYLSAHYNILLHFFSFIQLLILIFDIRPFFWINKLRRKGILLC